MIFSMSFSHFIKGKRDGFKNQGLGYVGKMVHAKLKLIQLLLKSTKIFFCRLQAVEGLSANHVQKSNDYELFCCQSSCSFPEGWTEMSPGLLFSLWMFRDGIVQVHCSNGTFIFLPPHLIANYQTRNLKTSGILPF